MSERRKNFQKEIICHKAVLQAEKNSEIYLIIFQDLGHNQTSTSGNNKRGDN